MHLLITIVLTAMINPQSKESTFENSYEDEICDNAIDDDGDGLIDLNDPDCACILVEPLSLIANPSFEETNCCPNEQSELFCSTGWIQASVPTTDFLYQFNPKLPHIFLLKRIISSLEILAVATATSAFSASN